MSEQSNLRIYTERKLKLVSEIMKISLDWFRVLKFYVSFVPTL